MKPASLVAIVLRLFAIYTALKSLLTLAFTLRTGDYTFLTLAVGSIILSILLYRWSATLGRLIARNLD